VTLGAAIALAVAAPALAPFALKGLAAIGIATTTAVATAIVGVALAAGMAIAFKALGIGSPKPSSNVGPPQVFRQSISHSFIVYGKRRVGGLMVFFHARQSGDDHFRYFVIACAGHRCNGLTKWFLNDEEVTVDGSNKVTTGKYANAAWLWFQEGNASETANATFVSECGGKWTTNHKGNGVAAIYAKFQMTEEVVQAGMPNITAEIEGKDDIYDPRTETSGYTRNAALIFYDWMELAREEGGFGAYADEIPDADYISAQANVCDETVNSLPRYAIDAVIQTGAPPAEIRDVLIVNMGGSYTYSGGKHLARPGYWVPPSETLGEDDFAGPLQVSPFLPGDQAANEIQGTYIEPSDGYMAAPFATQSVASSDVRQMDLDLAFTTNKHQAERIASIMLNRAQCEKTVVCTANIEGLKIKALDTISLDTTRYGLSNYAFQVINWGLSADWNVVLTLREENEDIYDAPSPVSPPSIPDISVPDPLGGPVNPDDFLTGDAPTIDDAILTGTTDLQGGQIKFPATAVPSADPNTLDDYEEGTFTPILRFGGNGVGMTFAEQTGRYTKIGRQVTVHVRIRLSAKGSSTGNAEVRSLPFTSNSSLPGGITTVLANAISTATNPIAAIANNTANVSLLNQGTSFAALTNANFADNSEIYFTLTYET
jgi:hypothetical protein